MQRHIKWNWVNLRYMNYIFFHGTLDGIFSPQIPVVFLPRIPRGARRRVSMLLWGPVFRAYPSTTCICYVQLLYSQRESVPWSSSFRPLASCYICLPSWFRSTYKASCYMWIGRAALLIRIAPPRWRAQIESETVVHVGAFEESILTLSLPGLGWINIFPRRCGYTTKRKAINSLGSLFYLLLVMIVLEWKVFS